jgi:hypothetical protein
LLSLEVVGVWAADGATANVHSIVTAEAMASDAHRFDNVDDDNRFRMSIFEIFGRNDEGRHALLDAASRILSEGPCSPS